MMHWGRNTDTIEDKGEYILDWFRKSRSGRYTSYMAICKQFCLMGKMKEVVIDLVKRGKLKKLKSGYKLVDKEIKKDGSV